MLKRIFAWAALAIFALVLLGVLVGVFLPSRYRVERSIDIQAPAERVFAEVNDLRRNEAWSPWKVHDPSMRYTYPAASVGEGAIYRWTSRHSGAGELKIVRSIPYRRIDTELHFMEQGKARGYWRFAPEGTRVHVRWGFEGDAGWNLPGRYFGLMMNRWVGPHFEEGLRRLKGIAEGAS